MSRIEQQCRSAIAEAEHWCRVAEEAPEYVPISDYLGGLTVAGFGSVFFGLLWLISYASSVSHPSETAPLWVFGGLSAACLGLAGWALVALSRRAQKYDDFVQLVHQRGD